MLKRSIILSLLAAVSFASCAVAQIAIVPNDNKLYLVNGTQTVAKTPAGDSVSILDLGATPPKLIATLEGIPTSVIGPPLCAAVAPDESFALVTASMKVDPADGTKQTENNKVTVIDLKTTPPHVHATLEAGKGPAAVSINRAGTLALVSNRGEGTVSIFSIAGKTVKNVGKLEVGNAASALGHVAITPDGKRAILSRDGENTVSVLNIDGEKVTLSGQNIRVGSRPYGMDISPDGKVALVATIGGPNTDIIGVLDLSANPVTLAGTHTVPATAEGVTISRDGKWAAVVCHNGSAKAKESPQFNQHGKVIVFSLAGTKLTHVADADIGGWSQGVAFSADGKTIAVTNMVEKELQFLSFDGKALKTTGTMKMPGGPVAIRVAEK
jgi:DNA-binding beta-propeller fold protein YncE